MPCNGNAGHGPKRPSARCAHSIHYALAEGSAHTSQTQPIYQHRRRCAFRTLAPRGRCRGPGSNPRIGRDAPQIDCSRRSLRIIPRHLGSTLPPTLRPRTGADARRSPPFPVSLSSVRRGVTHTEHSCKRCQRRTRLVLGLWSHVVADCCCSVTRAGAHHDAAVWMRIAGIPIACPLSDAYAIDRAPAEHLLQQGKRTVGTVGRARDPPREPLLTDITSNGCPRILQGANAWEQPDAGVPEGTDVRRPRNHSPIIHFAL